MGVYENFRCTFYVIPALLEVRNRAERERAQKEANEKHRLAGKEGDAPDVGEVDWLYGRNKPETEDIEEVDCLNPTDIVTSCRWEDQAEYKELVGVTAPKSMRSI